MLMKLAIESLPIYASVSSYFLIIAPDALHEAQRQCTATSYLKRGWCAQPAQNDRFDPIDPLDDAL